MDIDQRLKADAARVNDIQPPAGLAQAMRRRLGAAEPPPARPRRWFASALALLCAAMVAAIVGSGQFADFLSVGSKGVCPPHVLSSEELPAQAKDLDHDQKQVRPGSSRSSEAAPDEANSYDSTPKQAELEPCQSPTTLGRRQRPPWLGAGVFSILAIPAGAIWFWQWRRRNLALALTVPAVVISLGYLWLFREFILVNPCF